MAVAGWSPSLDLSAAGLSRFDPARVQQAVDEGWQAGFDAGRAEAAARARESLEHELDAAREQVAVLLAALAEAVDDAGRAEAQAAATFAASAARTAVALAESILGRELADEAVAATAAAERALAAIGRRPGTVVRLHPLDLALVDGAAVPEGVQLIADRSLRRGDALAETDDRTVDARIGAALARALAVLDGTEATS